MQFTARITLNFRLASVLVNLFCVVEFYFCVWFGRFFSLFEQFFLAANIDFSVFQWLSPLDIEHQIENVTTNVNEIFNWNFIAKVHFLAAFENTLHRDTSLL